MNNLMEAWPAARYVTGTLEFRMFERRTQRGILYSGGGITYYPTTNRNPLWAAKNNFDRR